MAARSIEWLVNTTLAVTDVRLPSIELRAVAMRFIESGLDTHCAAREHRDVTQPGRRPAAAASALDGARFLRRLRDITEY